MKKINFSIGVRENDGSPEVMFLIDLLSDYAIAESGLSAHIRIIDSLLKIQSEDPLPDNYINTMIDFRNILSRDIQNYSRYQELLQTEIADQLEKPKDIKMSTRIRNLLGII